MVCVRNLYGAPPEVGAIHPVVAMAPGSCTDRELLLEAVSEDRRNDDTWVVGFDEESESDADSDTIARAFRWGDGVAALRNLGVKASDSEIVAFSRELAALNRLAETTLPKRTNNRTTSCGNIYIHFFCCVLDLSVYNTPAAPSRLSVGRKISVGQSRRVRVRVSVVSFCEHM